MSEQSRSQSPVQITGRPRRVRNGNRRLQKQFEGQYGVTRQEVDVILTELCQQYDCQWAIVSTALYKQHKIRMNQSRIKDRYTSFLDPKLKRDRFTDEEEVKILKQFCVLGKRFKYFREVYPNRDRCMIKTAIETRIRQGLKKLEGYIWQEIIVLPEEEMIGNGEVNKCDLIRWLVSQTQLLWDDNQATYKLLYFFIVSKWDSLKMIPKDLAMLLYKRLAEIRREVEESKAERLNKIDPSLYSELNQKQEKKKRKYTSDRIGSNSSGHSESVSLESNDCKNEERGFDLSVSQLRIEKDMAYSSYSDLKIEEIEKDLDFEGLILSPDLDVSFEDLQFIDQEIE